MRAVAVVIKLVGQVQKVEVAIEVEGADRIGVVSPTFIAGNVALYRPAGSAVEGLVEAHKVVVAFGAHEPLAGADEMHDVGGISLDVRLGMVLDQHRSVRWIAWIAARLRGVRAEVLAGGRGARAQSHPVVAIIWAQAPEVGRLRRVASGLQSGREDVPD